MKKSNRKNNSVGKRFFFIAALLCAFSLSGCSTAIQSLADGTDAILNGLADGTGQMLDSLTKADDGRLKDRLLEAYGALLDEAGSTALTPEGRLKGRLEKGKDDYTGSYEADGASTYIGVWGDHADGSVSIEIE